MNAHNHRHHPKGVLHHHHAAEITGQTSGIASYSIDQLHQVLADAATVTHLKYSKLLLEVANHEARHPFQLDNLADGHGRNGGVVSRGLMQIAPATLTAKLEEHRTELEGIFSKPEYGNRFKAALDWMKGDHSHAAHEALLKTMYDPMFSGIVGSKILQDCGGNSAHPGRAYLSYVHPGMAGIIAHAKENGSTESALQLARDNGVADAVVTNNPAVFGADGAWTAQEVIDHNDKKFEGVMPPEPVHHHAHHNLKAAQAHEGHHHHLHHHHKHHHHHHHHHHASSPAAPAAPPPPAV